MLPNPALRIGSAYEKFLPMNDVSLLDAWSSVFGARTDSVAFLEGLSGIWNEFDRFFAELDASNASDRAKQLYWNAANKLRPFSNFAQFSSQNAGHVKRQADSINLMFLAADAIGGERPATEINPLTLAAITEQLSELVAALETLEIDPKLRSFLKFQLGNMLQAVASFEAIGIEGLSRIYGATASEVARAFGSKEAQQPQAKKWLLKARETLKLIGAGVVWAGAVTGGADSALEHGTHLLEFAGVVEAASTGAAASK